MPKEPLTAAPLYVLAVWCAIPVLVVFLQIICAQTLDVNLVNDAFGAMGSVIQIEFTDPCGNVTCGSNERCFASTGQCAKNPCSTIICPQEYPICHTIDAVNAICVADACEGVMCGAGQRCLQSTGRCSPGCSDPTPLQNRGIGTSPFRRLIWDSWDAKLNFTRQWFQLNVTGPTDISGFSVTVNDSAISDANCVDVQLFTKCDAMSEVVAAPKKRIVYNSAEIVFHFGGQLERNGGNLFVLVDVNACDAGLFAPLRMSTLTHKTHCVYKKISASPINY
eukprot:747287_1